MTLEDDNQEEFEDEVFNEEGSEAENEEAGEEESGEGCDDQEEITGNDDAGEDGKDEDGDGDTVLLIGDEEPEEEIDDAKAPDWVKKLRKDNREKSKRIKELEAKVGASEKDEEELGERPTLEKFDYDEEKHAAALLEWGDKKKAIEAREAQKANKEKEHQERFDRKLVAYNKAKASVGVADFDSLEERVTETLDVMQQGMIVTAAKEPAKMIAALGRYPKHLQRLAKIEDPVEFIAETVRLEMNVKTATPKKPAPERRVKGSSKSFAGSTDKQMQALEQEAEISGDRTRLIAYKRKLRQAN